MSPHTSQCTETRETDKQQKTIEGKTINKVTDKNYKITQYIIPEAPKEAKFLIY